MGRAGRGLSRDCMKAKRVNIVSLKMVKEASVYYAARNVNTPVDAADVARSFIEDADREMLIVICLDTKNKLTAIQTVSVGTLNTSQVHPREIFKVALLANSAGIILAHNHTSGDPTPSREDIQITERLKKCGELLGVSMIDHIIIGSEGQYTSLQQKRLL